MNTLKRALPNGLLSLFCFICMIMSFNSGYTDTGEYLAFLAVFNLLLAMILCILGEIDEDL